MELCTVKRIVLILALTGIAGCDSPPASPPPSPAAVALSHDARAIKSLHDQLLNIETTYGDAMDAFTGVLTKAVLGQIDASNRQEVNEAGSTGLRIGQAILAQSAELQAPDMIDPQMRMYASKIVTAHKAWARALQSRDTAFANANLERAGRFKDAADVAASQEAANLILAYRQVGLSVE